MEELIVTREDAEEGRGGRFGARVRGVSAVLSLAALAWTGGVEVFDPPEEVRLVGDERAEADAAASHRAIRDGSLARSIETNFRLRGRVRRQLGPWWSLAMLYLGDIPGQKLIAGKEGWLFLRDRVLMEPEAAASGADVLGGLFAALRRSLRRHGSELVVLPLPRKAVVCQDMLPDGIDPRARADRAVLQRLNRHGAVALDLLDGWRALKPDEAYMFRDSHWAQDARLWTARAIRSWIRGDEQVVEPLPEAPGRPVALLHADLLTFMGIPEEHRAFVVAGATSGTTWTLSARLPEKDAPEVLLAGSSFSARFEFQAILEAELGARVKDASEPGRLPFHCLSHALVDDQDTVPSTVLAEFPIHQAAYVKRTSSAIFEPAAALLAELNGSLQFTPIEPALLADPVVRERALELPCWGYRAGSLISSGDGVLLVEFQFSSEASSTWFVDTGGARFPIVAPAGESSFVLPILEAEDLLGNLSLTPTSESALTAEFNARVVTDVDLGSGAPIRPSTLGAVDAAKGVWFHEGAHEVQPSSALVLEWAAPSARPWAMELSGTDAAGRPVSQRWEVDRKGPRRFGVFGLGPLEGGALLSVRVTGFDGELKVSLTPSRSFRSR